MKKCFVNFKLIDGTGNEMMENCCMTVENGLITSIDANIECHCDCEKIDLEGQYVMPGMID